MQKGQSLIEILIGVTVAGIVLFSAVSLIGVVLRVSGENKYIQSATFLSKDLLARVKEFATQKWYCTPPNAVCGIYTVDKGSDNKYTLKSDDGAFVLSTDEEDMIKIVDGISYTNYFYVENVSRDSAGVIEQGYDLNNDDPSTQKVTAVTNWTSGNGVMISEFVTRSGNRVYVQTDWSGGATSTDVVLSQPTNTFFTSDGNLDFSVPGQISIDTNP